MKDRVTVCAVITSASLVLAGCAGGSSAMVSDTVSLDEFKALEISASSYDVTLTRGDSYAVEYSCESGSEPKTKVKDGALKISQPSSFWSGLMSGIGKGDAYYKITIPDGAEEISLEVRSSSGDVTLDRIKASGTIKTSSGAVMLNDVEGEFINVETDSGEIDGDKIKTGAVSFGTSSGNVEMLRVESSDFSCNTSSGSIAVNNSAARNVMCQTSSGSVDIELLGPTDEYSYYTDTSSGDVTVNGEKADKEYVKDDGKAGKVAVHTSSGDINISVSEPGN